MEKIWQKSYPHGVPFEVDLNRYQSISDLFFESCKQFRDKPAFINFGSEMSFEELFFLTNDFAGFLQSRGLKKGDRIALQMPNILQYPVVMFAALRMGLIVVNCNPLYTPSEIKHQLKNSGAKAIVAFNGSAANLSEILDQTNIETVVITEIGDLLGWPKSLIVNASVKYIKKMITPFQIANHFSFYEALDIGHSTRFDIPELNHDDLAFLQYTGGTTGVAKGAMLSHGNVIANMLQMVAWMKPLLKTGEEVTVGALPLYHIFSMTLNCLAFMYYGAANVLITNPRDLKGFIKTLKQYQFTAFPGLNTLFNGLMNHPDFGGIDFSALKISVAGGMALQNTVARNWSQKTKVPIVEGYGLTETSPVTHCNPIDGTERIGTIGLPLPSTMVKLVDDNGKEVKGEAGELCIKGPQVMKGYWQNDAETKNIMLEGGWLRTGDIATMDQDGFFKIVDRKKDMILVSGFNVYPNEIEDVVSSHPQVLEVAAIGIEDEKSGEVVKICVVKKDPQLTEKELREFCKKSLTHYKIPKVIEFYDSLPKSAVGKILRKELRSKPK